MRGFVTSSPFVLIIVPKFMRPRAVSQNALPTAIPTHTLLRTHWGMKLSYPNLYRGARPVSNGVAMRVTDGFESQQLTTSGVILRSLLDEAIAAKLSGGNAIAVAGLCQSHQCLPALATPPQQSST